MKSVCFLLTTFSLAAGQLRHSVTDAIANRQQDELTSTQDVKPGNSLGVAEDDPIALGLIDGLVDISGGDIVDEDRDLFITRICQYIETLFYSQVICSCAFSTTFDVIGYSCNRFTDVEKGNIIYTPNFYGSFVVGLFTGSLTIPGGICADKFSVYVEDLGTFLNLGDMCVTTEIVLKVTRVAPYVDVDITECTLDLGILGGCTCTPCVAGGLPGYSAVCATAAGGGGGIAVPCTPLAIPLFRSSGKTDPTTITDQLNLDEAIQQQVEEYKKQVAAGGGSNQNEQNANKDEGSNNQNNGRSDCHNGLCNGKRDQNEDRNVVDKNKVNNDNKGNAKDSDNTTGGGTGVDDKDTNNINGGNTGDVTNTGDVPNVGNGGSAASGLGEPGSGRPHGIVGWGVWDSVRNFFT